MLIRHTPCFLLLAQLDHPVAVVLATLVAALVTVVGLAAGPALALLVLAVRTAVIARAADDELAAAPPAHDPPSVRPRSHSILAASAENFVQSIGSCDLSPAPLARARVLRRAPRLLSPLADLRTYRAGDAILQFHGATPKARAEPGSR